MKPLRFAIIGTGFWSNFQAAAWKELSGVELVAVYNRTRSRAQAFADRFNVNAVYDDIELLFKEQQLDFVDIISDVDTHAPFTKLAAQHGVAVICQKPMSSSLKLAKEMLDDCKNANVPLFIHENFRWQSPIRHLKNLLDSNELGKPFKARVSFCSAFPVFENQPFLAELDQFILTDIGSHVLDICRFLFGEVEQLFCLTQTVNPKIKGEDVANVFMRMESGLDCFAEMSYASILEKESFPQTLVLVEAEKGSIQLLHDYTLKITSREGTRTEIATPATYTWADPAYTLVHSSIVDCNRDILNGLNGGRCETTGEDNFKTVKLIWTCYDSAITKKTIELNA